MVHAWSIDKACKLKAANMLTADQQLSFSLDVSAFMHVSSAVVLVTHCLSNSKHTNIYKFLRRINGVTNAHSNSVVML